MNNESSRHSKHLAPSQRRLQREADFTGQRLNSFRQVLLRHGLPGFLIGLLLLIPSDLRALLSPQNHRLEEHLPIYGLGFLGIFCFSLCWSWYIDRRISWAQAGWIFYLLLVSIWEEWVFRVALPTLIVPLEVQFTTAVLISNILFGAVHYFTLRWKASWCLLAFLGGMGFSHNYAELGDLFVIIGIHWLATFINTPRLPGSRPGNSA